MSMKHRYILPEIKCIHKYNQNKQSQNKHQNEKDFNVPELEAHKNNVIKAKNRYDKPYEDHRKKFTSVGKQFEHSVNFRTSVHLKYNSPNISNAWLKAYELFSEYNAFPTKADKFVYFDNAAFPGSFILAAYHYVNTMCEINNFEWYGSSMIEQHSDEKIGLLIDKYNLYNNYKAHWLMDTHKPIPGKRHNNGDVTVWDNQLQFREELGDTVDLYTSDLGFDVSSDYNKQEEMQSYANLGQIITGLLVLKKGGILMTKQYSYFDSFTISMMGVITKMFHKVEISKPLFSKSSNSETYLIGIGYKGYAESKQFIDILSDRLKKWEYSSVVSKDCLGQEYMDIIIDSQKELADIQIDQINKIIDEFDRIKHEHKPKISQKYTSEVTADLDSWKARYKMKRLTNSMDVTEVLFRKANKSKFKKRKHYGGDLTSELASNCIFCHWSIFAAIAIIAILAVIVLLIIITVPWYPHGGFASCGHTPELHT
jgi:hypothetical protein